MPRGNTLATDFTTIAQTAEADSKDYAFVGSPPYKFCYYFIWITIPLRRSDPSIYPSALETRGGLNQHHVVT
jgi:hypothetical protein